MNKEIRKMIDEAERKGFTIRRRDGHTWAWIVCSAVRGWFRHHFPDRHFEVDHQADVANLVVRARNLARGEHTTTWTRLLTSS